jgi:hypothetical protein
LSFKDTRAIEKVLQTCLPKIATFTKVEGFKLNQLASDQLFFVKEIVDKSKFVNLRYQLLIIPRNDVVFSEVQFKCVSTCFFAQCFKHYFKKPITEQDRKFTFNGCLATFDKSLFQ